MLRVCELFGETILNMVGCILLLNVMELLSMVGGALLDRPCMVFQRMCVLCLWSQWAPRCSFHYVGSVYVGGIGCTVC